MSRNFHTLHVKVGDEADDEQRISEAIARHLTRQGFEPTASSARADRTIRLSRSRRGWTSIHDDGYGISGLTAAIARATRLPTLEAYCEASAIVWLELRAGGRRLGAWSRESGGNLPSVRAVERLLVRGTAAEFAARWAQAIVQVFPETALAEAARSFGIDRELLFDDKLPRGLTLRFRRRQTAWKPVQARGAPSLSVGMGTNQGWGPAHLLFVDREVPYHVALRSEGGPGRGLQIRFGGSAIENGLVEITRVACPLGELTRDDLGWSAPDARISAGIANPPDTWTMTRREAGRARAAMDKTSSSLDLALHTRAEGTGALRVEVTAGGGAPTTGTLELAVLFQPYRPKGAVRTDDHTLFAMHRLEHVYAMITLNLAPVEGWAWSAPRVARWAELLGAGGALRAMRDGEVLLSEPDPYDDTPLAQRSGFRALEGYTIDATGWLELAGASFVFGHVGYRPFTPHPGETPVVALLLAGQTLDDNTKQLDLLRAIADEAMIDGVAYSALLGQHQYPPHGGKTPWEDVVLRSDDPIKYQSWHASRVRGLDHDGLWLAPSHVARIDRARIPAFVDVAPVGSGLRLRVPRDRSRRDFAPIEDALEAILPSEAAADDWIAAHRR